MRQTSSVKQRRSFDGSPDSIRRSAPRPIGSHLGNRGVLRRLVESHGAVGSETARPGTETRSTQHIANEQLNTQGSPFAHAGSSRAAPLDIKRPTFEQSIQLYSSRSTKPISSVAPVAAAGAKGVGTAVPYLNRIQTSFGHHDIGNVRAHFGSTGALAAATLGAKAYATNESIVFATPSPTLRLVAHEAAHIIQQRSSLRLPTGVGRPGDEHERHADRVADRVVHRRPATDLLDTYSPRRSSGPWAFGAVQMWNDRDLSEARVRLLRLISEWENLSRSVANEQRRWLQGNWAHYYMATAGAGGPAIRHAERSWLAGLLGDLFGNVIGTVVERVVTTTAGTAFRAIPGVGFFAGFLAEQAVGAFIDLFSESPEAFARRAELQSRQRARGAVADLASRNSSLDNAYEATAEEIRTSGQDLATQVQEASTQVQIGALEVELARRRASVDEAFRRAQVRAAVDRSLSRELLERWIGERDDDDVRRVSDPLLFASQTKLRLEQIGLDESYLGDRLVAEYRRPRHVPMEHRALAARTSYQRFNQYTFLINSSQSSSAQSNSVVDWLCRKANTRSGLARALLFDRQSRLRRGAYELQCTLLLGIEDHAVYVRHWHWRVSFPGVVPAGPFTPEDYRRFARGGYEDRVSFSFYEAPSAVLRTGPARDVRTAR